MFLETYGSNTEQASLSEALPVLRPEQLHKKPFRLHNSYKKLYNSYILFLQTYGSNMEQASLSEALPVLRPNRLYMAIGHKSFHKPLRLYG